MPRALYRIEGRRGLSSRLIEGVFVWGRAYGDCSRIQTRVPLSPPEGCDTREGLVHTLTSVGPLPPHFVLFGKNMRGSNLALSNFRFRLSISFDEKNPSNFAQANLGG